MGYKILGNDAGQENRSDDQGLVDLAERGTQAEGSECVLFSLNYLKVIADSGTRASDEIV